MSKLTTTQPNQKLTTREREEVVRRYWIKGDLTPLAIANSLAGQRVPQAA